MIWREKKRLVDKYSNQDSKTGQFLALGNATSTSSILLNLGRLTARKRDLRVGWPCL